MYVAWSFSIAYAYGSIRSIYSCLLLVLFFPKITSVNEISKYVIDKKLMSVTVFRDWRNQLSNMKRRKVLNWKVPENQLDNLRHLSGGKTWSFLFIAFGYHAFIFSMLFMLSKYLNVTWVLLSKDRVLITKVLLIVLKWKESKVKYWTN